MTVRSFLMLTCLIALSFAARAAETGEKKIVLIEDRTHRQWCAWPEGKAADAAIKKSDAYRVATLTYSDGHFTKIVDADENESGDFSVSDYYFLDSGESLTRFERHTYTFNGNTEVQEIFTAEGGKLHKVGTYYFDLTTHKPVAISPELYPEPGQPIHENLKELPYFALVQNPAILTGARICVRVLPPKSGP